MIARPAGRAVLIIVVTSVLIVPTAVVKAPVNASPMVLYLLELFLIYAYKAKSLENAKGN